MNKQANIMNSVVAWAIALLGAGVCAFMVSGSLQHFGEVNDLPEYYAGGNLLLSGKVATIYNLPVFYEVEHSLFPSLIRGVGLFLPPLAVPLLIPVSLLPIALAPQLWTGLISAALCIAVYLTARYFGLHRQALAWMLGLAMLSGPVIEGLRIGQLAPLLLLALTGFMFCARANKVVGAAAALAFFVLKPQQMYPLVIFLIGNKKYRILGIAAAIVIALTLISIPFFGIDGYMQYLKVVTDKGNLVAMQPELNATVRGQFMRLLTIKSNIPTILGIASLIGFSIYAFLLGRRFKDSPRWIEAALAGAMPLGLVTSMHCHDYDLVLLIPGLLVVMQAAMNTRNRAAIIALVCAASFLQPFYADIHYTMLLKNNAPVNPHFIALLILSIACAVLVWTSPREKPESQ